MTSTGAIQSYNDIGGWFTRVDRLMFDTVLSNQTDMTGDLVELGAYLGRSAVIIADHLQPEERFVVVDLFGSDEGLADDREDNANKRENANSYSTLSRERFEQNFLALHDELPHVVQGLSSQVMDHVKPGSVRFAHIDASHMYDKVVEDITNVATLLMPNGVVVLDDFRAPHTPGVAAATWEAIREGGLKPFVTTSNKLYATYGDADRYRSALREAAVGNRRLKVTEQPLREHTIAIVQVLPSVVKAETKAAEERRRAAAVSRAKAEAKNEVAAQTATQQARKRATQREKAAEQARRLAEEPRAKQLARDLAPPALTRWVGRKRRARG